MTNPHAHRGWPAIWTGSMLGWAERRLPVRVVDGASAVRVVPISGRIRGER
jgi:hypothetical protein